jgi:hypothetical protein
MFCTKDVKSRRDSAMINNQWPMPFTFLRPRVILRLSHHMESGDLRTCCGHRTKIPPFGDEEPHFYHANWTELVTIIRVPDAIYIVTPYT